MPQETQLEQDVIAADALQKLAGQKAATEAPRPATPVATITLKHPLTNDVKVVAATPEAMIPLMGRGYQQVKG